MNLEEAVRRLNGYLQRRGTVDGSGGWTEQWLLDALTDANQDLYHRAVQYGPEIYHETTEFTYPGNSVSIILKDYLGARPLALWYVSHLSRDESVSANNLPMQIEMPRRTDLDVGGLSTSSIASTTSLTDSAAAFSISVANATYATYTGFYLGDEFMLRPIPRQAIYMYIRWTPEELPALVDKGQDLLGGQLAQFHPAVVLKAAISAKSAKGEDSSQLERLYLDRVGQHETQLKLGARSRQRQQPPQREPMRWEY
jgi:hypothetical protein